MWVYPHSTKDTNVPVAPEADMTMPGELKSNPHWENLMAKMSAFHHEPECKAVPKSLPKIKRKIRDFPTGTSYIGSWDILGISGEGVYTYPGGSKYEGGFRDGEFHGDGKLIYPNGCFIKGNWKNGVIRDREIFFPNGLEYKENWQYCRMPDRRYAVELNDGIKPAGESHVTAEEPTPDIPIGKYDVGDGFYDPVSTGITSYKNVTELVRSPGKVEQNWIKRTNRYNNTIKHIGPQRSLYEDWQEPLLEIPYTTLRHSYVDDQLNTDEKENSSTSKLFNFGDTSTDTVKSLAMELKPQDEPTTTGQRKSEYNKQSILFRFIV